MTKIFLLLCLWIAGSAHGGILQNSELVKRQLIPDVAANGGDYILYFPVTSVIYVKKIQTGIFPTVNGYTIISVKYANGDNAQEHLFVDFGYNPRGSSETFAPDSFRVLPGQVLSIDFAAHYGGVPTLEEVQMYYTTDP